jgi:DNA modification methylase
MEWLVKMVTPKGGTLLDPFAGSGTTGQAALNCGMKAVLIEREDEYVEDIKRRFSKINLDQFT